ncbi:MAG: ABC transporter ATP-binding protein [Pseudobdellovibrio sp.]
MKKTTFSKTVYDTLLQAYRPFIVKLVMSIVLGFIGRLLMLSNAQIIGQFIDHSTEINTEDLKVIVVKLFFIITLSFILTTLFRTLFSRYSALAVSRIYDETTYRVSRFPISFFDDQPVGKITTRFSSDYGNIFRLFGGPLAEFISILFDLISIVILMIFVHPYFIFTILFSTWLYSIILKKNQLRLRQSRRELSINRSPSIAHFSETAQGSAVIRQNKKENMFIKKFLEYDAKYLNSKFQVFWIVTRFSLELNFLSALFFALNGLLCYYLIQKNIIGIGLASVVLSFTMIATNTLQMFFEWFSQFEEALVGVERLDEYLRLDIEPGALLPSYSDFATSHPKRIHPQKQQGLATQLIATESDYHLQTENLQFRYPKSSHIILNSISFKLKNGEKLGIIGRTGSGKSTLISALLHLYPIQAGVILVNGKNESDVEKHRSLFSVISQDQLFLTGSVRDNLDLFKDHSNLEIENILKQVGLKFSLQDPIFEKGQNLSQGEKQLLSLARGLLQKAEIFIFDEATSNVDPHSETLMNKALLDVLSKKTQIRIAHRLQTVEDCDQILWLDNGNVKIIGPAKEVLVAFEKARL